MKFRKKVKWNRIYIGYDKHFRIIKYKNSKIQCSADYGWINEIP